MNKFLKRFLLTIILSFAFAAHVNAAGKYVYDDFETGDVNQSAKWSIFGAVLSSQGQAVIVDNGYMVGSEHCYSVDAKINISSGGGVAQAGIRALDVQLPQTSVYFGANLYNDDAVSVVFDYDGNSRVGNVYEGQQITGTFSWDFDTDYAVGISYQSAGTLTIKVVGGATDYAYNNQACRTIIREFAFGADSTTSVNVSIDDVQCVQYSLIGNDYADSDGVIGIELDTVYYGNNQFASGDDVTIGGINDTRDLWYSFTPDVDGIYVLSKTGYYDNTVSVFDVTGEDSSDYPAVVASDGEKYLIDYDLSSDIVSLLANNTYLIRVAGEGSDSVCNGAAEDYVFSLLLSYDDEIIENDLCSNPIVIEAEEIYYGDNYGTDGFDLWYSFTPDVKSVYQITATSIDGFNPSVVVTDVCGNVPFAPAGPPTNQLSITLEAGTEYLIGVGSMDANGGEFELIVEMKSPNLVVTPDVPVVYAAPNEYLEFPFTVTNVSYVDLEAKVDYYLDMIVDGESLYDEYGIVEDSGTISLTGIDAGESISAVATKQPIFLGPGAAKVICKVVAIEDSGDDLNLVDNQYQWPQVESGYPDLLISPIQSLSVVKDEFLLDISVSNLSDNFNYVADGKEGLAFDINIYIVPADQANTVEVIMQSDEYITDEIDYLEVAEIKAGSTVKLPATYDLTAIDPGDYDMVIEIVTPDIIQDADLTNNVSAIIPVVVKGRYDLEVKVDGVGGTIADASGTYVEGAEVDLETIPAIGYQVKAWTGTDDDNSSSNTNKVTIAGDTEVTVSFELISVELTIGESENGTITVSPESANGLYDYGTEITLTPVADNHFDFGSWVGLPDSAVAVDGSNAVKFAIVDDVNVSASFVQTEYVLSASVTGDGGTLNAVSGSYAPNTEVVLTATPENGYQVKTWSGTDDDTLTTVGNTVTMTGSKTVTVEFGPTSHTVTVVFTGGTGEVAALEDSYEYGETVDILVTPEANYKVIGWSGSVDDSSTDVSNQVVVTGDMTVTVELQYQPSLNYTIAGMTEGGTIPLTSGTYEPDQVVQLNVTLESGYIVKRWTGTNNDLTSSTSNTVTMDSDKDVTVEIALAQTAGSCKIKAGKTRGQDVFVMQGTTSVTQEQLLAGTSIVLDVWSESGFSFSDNIAYDPETIKKGVLKITQKVYKDSENVIALLYINTSKGIFKVVGKKFDLTGASVPLALSMTIGDYDEAVKASESDINGSGYMPMKLMNDYQDSLRVEKVVIRDRSKDNQDTVTATGSISFADSSIDLSANDLTLAVGETTITIPADSILYSSKSKTWIVKKYLVEETGEVVTAVINPSSCIFKISIARTQLTAMPETASVSIVSGDYSVSDTVSLTANNAGNVAVFRR